MSYFHSNLLRRITMEIQHIAAFMANEAKKEFLGGFSRWPMFSMLYKNSRTPI